jgi:hypothetical protein
MYPDLALYVGGEWKNGGSRKAAAIPRFAALPVSPAGVQRTRL